MQSFLSFGLLLIVLSFCGIGDRLKSLQGGSESGPASNSPTTTGDGTAEKAKMSASQQAIADSGIEVKWDDQGIGWKLPSSWKKMSVMKESFNYGSPDNAFLIGSVSVMADSFPSDVSLKATYESALEQLKQGKYEKVRYLEIDGVKGVEWWESMPEDKDGPRRHQWIAFRRYQGQNQQLNIMLSTKGTNFEKHRDTFPAVMYSMTIPKG